MTSNVQYLRAHKQSPFAEKWKDRAIAVDKHNCLVFIVPARTVPGVSVSPDVEPLQISSYEGETFQQAFGEGEF